MFSISKYFYPYNVSQQSALRWRLLSFYCYFHLPNELVFSSSSSTILLPVEFAVLELLGHFFTIYFLYQMQICGTSFEVLFLIYHQIPRLLHKLVSLLYLSYQDSLTKFKSHDNLFSYMFIVAAVHAWPTVLRSFFPFFSTLSPVVDTV